MTITELVERAHGNASEKGFWNNRREVGTLLMLIVTELAEALEADRHGDMKNFTEEIADTFIRLADFCGGMMIDIEQAILDKMAINEQRPYLHGKQY